MIVLALLVQAYATTTFEQFKRLSPAVAGDILLDGRQHKPIESVVASTAMINAPGVIEAQLLEQPSTSRLGCIRQRWTIRFRARPNTDLDKAVAENGFSTTEIARAKPENCATASYVHLNPGVNPEVGFDALSKLESMRENYSHIKFECKDMTPTKFCDKKSDITASIQKMNPWGISKESDDILIWLGIPGQVVTEVRFDPAKPRRVIVTRSLPAPF